MCGRYKLEQVNTLALRFGALFDAPPQAPRFNVAPRQLVVVVVEEGERRLEAFQWGLIPPWAKDASIGNKMINARAETLAEKPAFRNALKRRRCLIPADGFYEWTGDGKSKHPLHIRLKDRSVFAFAGLWERWKQPESGEWVRTCTIVTTVPNELMAQYHHRMPVILRPDDEALWLDPEITEVDELMPLLAPYPAQEMEVLPASRLINSPANEGPELVEADD